mgnify:CR=1 FL=1
MQSAYSQRMSSSPLQANLYALGATVYYLLSGRTPRVSGEDLSQLATVSGTSERLTIYRDLLQKRSLQPLQALRPTAPPPLALPTPKPSRALCAAPAAPPRSG